MVNLTCIKKCAAGLSYGTGLLGGKEGAQPSLGHIAGEQLDGLPSFANPGTLDPARLGRTEK